jgi:hypothetical protein
MEKAEPVLEGNGDDGVRRRSSLNVVNRMIGKQKYLRAQTSVQIDWRHMNG